jgi:hypothetical protein
MASGHGPRHLAGRRTDALSGRNRSVAILLLLVLAVVAARLLASGLTSRPGPRAGVATPTTATPRSTPAPASAGAPIRITGMTCWTVEAAGSDLPRNARIQLVVVDQGRNRVLDTLWTTTGAGGTFQVADKVPTAGIRALRLLVKGPDGARIGVADHEAAAGHEACPLPSTGPARTARLLALAAALLALGTALLRSQSYWGTHLPSRA